MMKRRATSITRKKITLEELVATQKKAGYTIPEVVILTNNKQFGQITNWTPPEAPEQFTIEINPALSEKIKALTLSTELIYKIEERKREGEVIEFYIWIDHHELTTELGQHLPRRLLIGL